MQKLFILFFIFCFTQINVSHAQGAILSIKAGPTLGTQKWDSQDKEPLISYHGLMAIESIPYEGKFSLFAQAGYHTRGSSIRIRSGSYTDVNGVRRDFPGRKTKYEFRNIVLSLGAKQRFDFGNTSKVYYMFGIRGEYTIDTNLEEFIELNQQLRTLYHPDPGLVRKINYGPILGGGIEFPFSEHINGFIETTINPDFSLQYEQAPFTGYDPYTGNNRNFSKREIRNVTVELTFGVSFLRKVEYIDGNLF